MRWLRTLVVFDRGNVVDSTDWKSIHDSYVRAIQAIDFPKGSGKLLLRRHEPSDGQQNRNGVGYIKAGFMEQMVGNEGWKAEEALDLGNQEPPELRLYPSKEPHRERITSKFGKFDLVTTASAGMRVAIEWETGNISSSHRSMNKLAIALATGKIQAGVMIVPSRDLYAHLTDRIGNIGELSGYLAMWKDIEVRVERGLLAITVVEHDELTSRSDWPYLPSGNDGRARQGAAKKTRKS